ncbi:MAG: DSBA oxidoreductase [Hyphococcus sp.]|nr:MAG: DSBA oxidoreductase [Marinicaulis sp.]
MTKLDIYWSFRSPYSYLAIDRLVEIKRDFNVDIGFRPVRPLVMRESDFFEKGRAQFLPYLFQDVPREAERLGLSFSLPNPDPVDMDMVNGMVAPDQPILDKVMGLAIAATKAGSGLEFAQAVSRSIWGGTTNWHEDEVLAATLNASGLSLQPLAKWSASSSATIEQVIAENEAAQLKHHWGVPLMVLDTEPFFGQDRIEALIWRMDKQGLRRG